MTFLYKKLDVLRETGMIHDFPNYIKDNLSQHMPVRPYQVEAFKNFITYFETGLRKKPSQTLFHMATGSGKTYVMAGLIIYLYKKGYRNFIFFVNLSNIVEKTKINFLNKKSSKYLFNDTISIDGENVKINNVTNFQGTDDNAINICFTTIQGLHTDIWFCKENAMTYDDFENKKVVLISDEAHHLNADTKKPSKDDEENRHSWEETVKRIVDANSENVLLEFTATCDLNNPNIFLEYENKIVYDYPLKKFRKDLYSKEIISLRTDLNIMQRAIQALVLSQYRLKIFKDHRINIKPIVLLKSAKIEDSKTFMSKFISAVKGLRVEDIQFLADLNNDKMMANAFSYFSSNGYTFEMLVQELKEDFSEEHCVSVNDDKDVEQKQLLLNSLEDESNPYRAVFEVKKLDEGWDVLNLFDIVRLYETRQSGKKISSATIAEAQLIGRGSRYCPFSIDDQNRFTRKYDSDINNPLHICETLVYHCQNDSRYIAELNRALREIGIEPESMKRDYILKADFKESAAYKSFVYLNERIEVDRKSIYGLPPSVRDKIYYLKAETGSSGTDLVLSDDNVANDADVKTYLVETTIKDICDVNYAIVNKAIACYPSLRFNLLHKYFPNLKSTREFITSDNYLGNIKITIRSRYQEPTMELLSMAVKKVLDSVCNTLVNTEIAYVGTKEFKPYAVSQIFKDKTVNFARDIDGGQGVSQNDISVSEEYRINLKDEDWYAFNDNWGTSEEKALVGFIKEYIDRLEEKYNKVYLLRNERYFHIYSFDAGERFEPDFVMLLEKESDGSYEQMQVFIEPKGEHLLEKDKWKEDFLLQIKDEAVIVKPILDNNDYSIIGMHFYNRALRNKEFTEDIQSLI